MLFQSRRSRRAESARPGRWRLQVVLADSSCGPFPDFRWQYCAIFRKLIMKPFTKTLNLAYALPSFGVNEIVAAISQIKLLKRLYQPAASQLRLDRKSTRLNSSH